MIAETTTPKPTLPEIRTERPGPCIVDPLDVEVDIFIPMPVKSVRMGKIVPRMVKAKPCIILDVVPDDE